MSIKTTHPDAPDVSGFQQVVDDLPGGEYIGDNWRTENTKVVAFTYDSYMTSSTFRDAIFAAFPPYRGHEAQARAGVPGHMTMTMVIPQLAYDILAKSDQGEELGMSVLVMPDHLKDHYDQHQYAALVAEMWVATADLEAETIAQHIEDVWDIAYVENVEFSTVKELAMTLWKDDHHRYWYKALEKVQALVEADNQR